MKKKIFLLFLILLGGLFWFKYKPLVDITKVGFTEEPTATPVAKKAVLQFTVVGDPESDLVNLGKIINRAKEKAGTFLIFAGDLTQVGSPGQLAEFKKVMDESGLEYYVVPGNHDLYTSRKQTKDAKKYFRDVFGTPYYQVIKNAGKFKVNFLFLDNSDEYSKMETDQINFLNNNLKKASNKLNFVFFHLPVFHPSSDYIMGYQEEIISKQKDELLSIFQKVNEASQTKFVFFAGHLHHTSSYEWSGMKMYVAGSANSLRNWQTPRYLEVKVFSDAEFEVKEVEL